MKSWGRAFIGVAILRAALMLGSFNVFSQAEPEPPRAGSKPVQAVKQGMLTYTARNQSLRSVLHEIGDQTGVGIVIADGLGEEPISVEFRGFRPDEALRQILKDYDTFFFYGKENGKETAPLKTVWIYPASKGRSLKPVPPEAWASTQEYERMLADRDPHARASALDTLIQRRGRRAGELVMKALRDDSDLVRTRALDRALSSDIDIPQETLAGLALNDKSVNVRFLSLEALSEDPSMRWVAERALQDPSEHVREMAQQILRKFDAANGSADGPVQGQQEQNNER